MADALSAPSDKRCADCEHCRVSGAEHDQSLRVWCRMGCWATAYLQSSRPGHSFSYRTLRAILKPYTDRLARIAAHCPFYASMDGEPTAEWRGRVNGYDYERKPD